VLGQEENGVEDDPVIPGSAWVWLECGQERFEDDDLIFGKISWVGLHQKFKSTRFGCCAFRSSGTNSNRLYKDTNGNKLVDAGDHRCIPNRRSRRLGASSTAESQRQFRSETGRQCDLTRDGTANNRDGFHSRHARDVLGCESMKPKRFHPARVCARLG
jgi:hypothetical protein